MPNPRSVVAAVVSRGTNPFVPSVLPSARFTRAPRIVPNPRTLATSRIRTRPDSSLPPLLFTSRYNQFEIDQLQKLLPPNVIGTYDQQKRFLLYWLLNAFIMDNFHIPGKTDIEKGNHLSALVEQLWHIYEPELSTRRLLPDLDYVSEALASALAAIEEGLALGKFNRARYEHEPWCSVAHHITDSLLARPPEARLQHMEPIKSIIVQAIHYHASAQQLRRAFDRNCRRIVATLNSKFRELPRRSDFIFYGFTGCPGSGKTSFASDLLDQKYSDSSIPDSQDFSEWEMDVLRHSAMETIRKHLMDGAEYSHPPSLYQGLASIVFHYLESSSAKTSDPQTNKRVFGVTLSRPALEVAARAHLFRHHVLFGDMNAIHDNCEERAHKQEAEAKGTGRFIPREVIAKGIVRSFDNIKTICEALHSPGSDRQISLFWRDGASRHVAAILHLGEPEIRTEIVDSGYYQKLQDAVLQARDFLKIPPPEQGKGFSR